MLPLFSSFFFFNDTATTEIYTLSLHDALPISIAAACLIFALVGAPAALRFQRGGVGLVIGMSVTPPRWNRRAAGDRKSTRLNSSHLVISYAVFCLKKKKKHTVSKSTITHNRL